MAVPVAAALASAGALASGMSSGPAVWGGVLGSLALAIAAVRARNGEPLLAGQAVSLAVGLGLLAVCGAGLDETAATQSWRSVLAIVAYPFLGQALLRLAAAHRELREADVLVESALVATAVGIVLHVAVSGWRAQTLTSAWGDAEGAFPAMLVALDVSLLVIGVRGLRAPAARQGALALLHVGVLCLFATHLLQELGLSQGHAPGLLARLLAFVGLLVLGTSALHPGATTPPDQLLEQPVLFSALHAGLIVVGLLAAPGVLAVQALREVTVSATVATGAVVSGAILAAYLTGLLRERAATEHEASHDALTKLPNRSLLVDRLDRSLAHAKRNGTACAVLFVDLDRFKEINDTFGHAAGDVLLQAVAERLTGCVRDEDTVARLSGDEFVVLLPHLSGPEHVIAVAERVLKAIGQPVTVAEERLLLSASIGIAVHPHDGDTALEVMGRADAAMYRAKETAGSSWEIFSAELATEAQTRLHIEAGLLDGIERDELVLHYQPIVDVPTGRTVGAEALVRWNHPERGFLLPGHFVPIAEQSDLIVLLGEQVILDACRELRRWQDLGLRDRFISVNVSARQFSHGVVETVTAALRATGADPKNLVIELTESTAVDNVDAIAAILDELRVMGIRSAIDDFGTGFCGLRYLGSLPVASLKIDQSFIQGMTPSAAAIVAATIAMGHSLGLSLIAEGVETEEQLRFLTDHGCDRVQGYFLGRPMPAIDLVDRMRSEVRDALSPTVVEDVRDRPAPLVLTV